MQTATQLDIRFNIGTKDQVEELFLKAKNNHHESYETYFKAKEAFGNTFSYVNESFRDFTDKESHSSLDIAILVENNRQDYLREEYNAILSYSGALGGENYLCYIIKSQKVDYIEITKNIENADDLSILVAEEVECMKFLSELEWKVDVLMNFRKLRKVYFSGKRNGVSLNVLKEMIYDIWDSQEGTIFM